MRRLRDALQNERSETTLDVAALELARVEFPGLDFESSLFRLTHLAEQVAERLKADSSGLEFIQVMSELLFETLQFRGNEGDYYDPRNSCLNSVLTPPARDSDLAIDRLHRGGAAVIEARLRRWAARAFHSGL